MSPLRWLPPLVVGAAAAVSAHAEPLTFDQALARAATSAPSLQASDLEVDAARSSARAAGALPDPKLTFGVENFPVTGPSAGRFGSEDMTMARLGVMQEVPNRAKRRALSDRASAEIDAAMARNRVERREARLAAALAWIDLYYAKSRLAALDEIEQALEPLLDATPSAVASGSARPAQAVAPQQWTATLEDRRDELQAAEARARAELARWTGDPQADVSGRAPAVEVDENAIRVGLDRHPTLHADEAVERRADTEVKLAKAEKRPDWSWEFAYQRRDPMFGDMVSAGVTVSLPLFPENRQDPVIAARLADANSARLRREASRRAIQASLEGDLADHVMHHHQWIRARDILVPLAKRRADLETASYAAGTADLADVLESFTGLAEARLELLDREAAAARDAARLNLAYGPDDQ